MWFATPIWVPDVRRFLSALLAPVVEMVDLAFTFFFTVQVVCFPLETFSCVAMAALFTFFLKIKVFQFLRKRPTPSVKDSVEEEHKKTAKCPEEKWEEEPDSPILDFATEAVVDTPKLKKISNNDLCCQLQSC